MPFGDVIAHDLVDPISINQGFAKRHNLQAKVDVTLQGGAAQASIFVADPRPQPIAIKLMERHPLGSQSFYPLQDKPWLVVVCSDPQDPQSYRAFEAHGQQGVNYARNIWHHPLLVRDAGDRFFIVDRAGTIAYVGAPVSKDGKDLYAANAVKAIKEGKKPEPARTKNSGCGVKYAKKA